MVYRFSITEYAPDKPWLIVSTGRESVELADDADFGEWAQAHWPAPRYKVTLDRPPLRPWNVA